MRRVTLLLSGVPQFVTLRDLSYNLDLLFNTDEIETFEIRDLPNHPQTKKRQIALDFRSGYDAMAAQEKLDGYTYELDNGREYTLHAKINKFEEYMCSESTEYQRLRWHGDDWMALTMIPNVSDRDLYKAHARLDAQLELLEKHKLVLEKEKELLSEKHTLKRKYGSMVSCLYEGPWTQPNHNVEQGCESETEVSPPKIFRSTSRDRWSISKPPRSRSRENRPRESHRSRSKDSGYVLPQIEWYEKTRELRSQSRERPRSSANSRDRRSSSRDRRYHRFRKHREQRSRSNDKDKNSRSTSREHGVRARSRSKERLARSRESRRKEHRSRSKERRSRSREQMSYRRSRSRDRTRHSGRGSRSDWDRRDRSLRSPDTRTNQLAIMPRSPRGKSPSERATGTPSDNTKYKADITNKQVYVKVENDANNTANEAATKENKSDNCTKKDKEKKEADKYNSKIKKAEKTASRVQALSKDIMILIAIVVDEIMGRDKIRITASNKLTFIRILDDLVQKRLEPIVRVRKNDDKEVLKKYKMKYPMEGDLRMIKQMLNEIPKLKVPEATVTVSSESEKSNVTHDMLDVDSGPTEQECNPTINLAQVESTDNAPQIKQEPTQAPIIIIDIDSADKPVPRNPQFVVVIKTLVKNMNKVIRTNKLGGEIKFTELKHVLRHILRNMLKGQGFLPREEIVRKFREVYPMENDEQFVRNTIKDIKDGKYPRLTGHIVDTPVPGNDGPDDIFLIEKQYDVVTVLDSDDDDVDKKPIDTPIIAKPNADPSRPMPGPSNVQIKTDPVNPDQTNPGSTNSGQDTPYSNSAQTTLLDISGEAKTSPAGPGQALKVTSEANPCQAKTAAKPGKDMPAPSSPVRANTGLPSQAQAGPVKPGQAKTAGPNASEANAGFANLSFAMPGSVDASQAKKGPYNLGQANIDVSNLSVVNTGFANLSLAMPRSVDASQAEKEPNNPGQAMPRPVNTNKGPNNPSQAKTGIGNPGQDKMVPGNSGQGKKAPNNVGQAKEFLNIPSQAKTCPGNPGQDKSVPGNPGQANKGASNAGQVKLGPNNPSQAKTCPGNPGQDNSVPGNPGQANKGASNAGQVKLGPNNPSQAKTCPGNPGQDKSVPGNPGQANKGASNAGQVKLGPNNPSQAKTCPGNPGQDNSVPGNPDQANKGASNAGQVKLGPNNPSQAKTCPGNPGQDNSVPGNPGQANKGASNAGQVKLGPNNPSQAKTCPGNPGQENSVPGNPGQANKGPRNAVQAKLGPNNPSQAKTCPGNLGQAITVSGDPSQAKQGLNNAGQANKGPNCSGQAKTASGNLGQAKNVPGNLGQIKSTPVNTGQVNTGFVNPSQGKTCPISSQAALNKENRKRASLDNTIQNLESSYDSGVVVISSSSGKVANSRKRKKRCRKRKSAGKVQENPAKGKNNAEDSEDKVNINAIEDSDNNLKVTAITIVTSLNELIAKSNASETEVEEPNEIKKEIEIEEEELDESSLQLPDGPRVTSITIMTSEAELFSLGQKDSKEVDEIKMESDVYYDAEDNLVNQIQRAFDDADFCNSIQSESTEQNNSEQFCSVNNSEQFSSVNNSEQFSSANNSEQFTSKAADVPQDSRSGQDDEETIESIFKYVASMY